MFIADLHIHSSFSRATAKNCMPEDLALAAAKKGLNLIGTGDFTHALWRDILRERLVPAEDGLFALKKELAPETGSPRFILSSEISSIYKKNGKTRKVHNMILMPSLEAAARLSARLESMGYNLHSDGRPILGLDSRDLLEITLEACPEAIFIPAHIWTPHFSLFGAYSGFDHINECFEDMTPYIDALETGLSSDPSMIRRVSMLDRFTLVSNSDAHSPRNLAREANLFDTDLSYPAIRDALKYPERRAFAGTLEFFSEEGKYHYDGHRNCKVCQSPEQSILTGGICPHCGKKLTLGVMHRVSELADRDAPYFPPGAPTYESLVPLPEVITACTGFSAQSQKGQAVYERLLRELGPELSILRTAPLQDVERVCGPAMAEGIKRLREGRASVSPGYDGEYGKVTLLSKDEIAALAGQTIMFPGLSLPAPQKAAQRLKASKKETKAEAPQKEQLNSAQERAVFSNARVTAVIAGPGTGKTKTLVARIAYWVEQRGISPAQVTAVTFTNKAAQEMRERLEQRLGGKQAIKGMTIGTFHAICLKMRGKNAPALIDEGAAGAILGQLIKEQELKLSLRDAQNAVSLMKSGAKEPDALCQSYNERLLELGVMDFDDVLLNVPDTPSPRFTHLLVDEFQDVNPVQYGLVRLFSQKSESLFVIGDPNQAIYGFRGSDAYCFDRLRQDEKGLTEITLSENYRSTEEILEASAQVLEGAAPMLHAARGKGLIPRLLHMDGAFEQALFIVKEIGRMVGGIDMQSTGAVDRIHSFSDIAVLYRTRRQSRLVEECLNQEGIPYRVSGRDEALFDPEAEKMLAFFRLLLNPSDLSAFQTCLKHLPQKEAQALFTRYLRTDKTHQALETVLQGTALQMQIPLFLPMLDKDKPQKMITAWLEGQQLPMAEWTDKLLRTAAFHTSMKAFLNILALGRESDIERYGGKRLTSDAVSLMTLHAAKGLEFPAVFLLGAAEGTIPLVREGGEPAPEDEERRLLYVGMTRARDELILLTPGPASPFLRGMPKELLHAEALRKKPIQKVRQVSLFD